MARDTAKDSKNYYLFLLQYIYIYIPTDGVSTLSWWWGLSAPETLRAMLAVA
jgi:hypothetical protein